jgi:hypothetical protein
VVEHLPSIQEALRSISTTAKKKILLKLIFQRPRHIWLSVGPPITERSPLYT